MPDKIQCNVCGTLFSDEEQLDAHWGHGESDCPYLSHVVETGIEDFYSMLVSAVADYYGEPPHMFNRMKLESLLSMADHMPVYSFMEKGEIMKQAVGVSTSSFSIFKLTSNYASSKIELAVKWLGLPEVPVQWYKEMHGESAFSQYFKDYINYVTG